MATVESDTNNATIYAKRKHVDLVDERDAIISRLGGLKPSTERYASEFVDGIFQFAAKIGTSDVHLQPTKTGLEVKFRSDGVLQSLGIFPVGANSSIVSRLKVICDLLTYQSEIPQEGRVVESENGMETRVSTFPTLYGERAVLRFFGTGKQFHRIDELGHTQEVACKLRSALLETSGAILITGPAGSGKSTTLYACMRHLVASTNGSRCLVSIEDPIEVPVDGVAQSKVNIAAGFDLDTGLRSLLRQDPEVIMVGEIRDRSTAEIAIQASLTGQLVLTTFHADSTATAISRLIEMGIEPYLLRSGLNAVMSQRLLRTLCDCSRESRDPDDLCNLPVEAGRVPNGCGRCNDTGFSGRVLISEFMSLRDTALSAELLSKAGSREIYRIAIENGMRPLWEQAVELVRAGRTSPAEVRRVLGAAATT
jgi:general secretion pathway protein E